jgi:hypothetical protein
MPIQVNDNGTLRSLTTIQVNDNGTLRTVRTVQVNDNGTLRTIHLAQFVLPSGIVDDTQLTGSASASVALNSNGSGTATNQSAFDWVTPTSIAPGGYTIRAHVASGTNPIGSALDTDLALSSNRSWTHNQSGVGVKTCVLELTLKDSLGNTVKTSSVNMTAEVLT